MGTSERKSLDYYLGRAYPFQVIASEDGGYVITFPDLPGCVTQAETIDEIGPLADDARRAWIETAYGEGIPIPEPTGSPAYSGKFLVRLPRSLHQALAEQAEREGVSLNQYVVTLLASLHTRHTSPIPAFR